MNGERRPAGSRRREALLLLAFTLGTTLVLLGLFEGATRLLFPSAIRQGTDASLLRAQGIGESVGWQPSARGASFDAPVTIDAHGFRALGGPTTAEEAWLLLGDSVTFGVGVPAEETFAGLLQARYPDVRIWNTAVIGYAIDDYVTVLQEFAKRGEPLRRVILALCLNDGAPRMTLPQDLPLATRIRYGLRDGSNFYQLLKGLLLDRSRDYYQAVLPHYEDGSAEFARLVSGIDALAAASRSLGIPLEVVLLPWEFPLRAPGAAAERPRQRLLEFLAQRGIRALDLAPDFVASGRPSRALYLYADAMHFSPEGHAVAAGSVAAWMDAEPTTTRRGE